jgi:hypothetical protein
MKTYILHLHVFVQLITTYDYIISLANAAADHLAADTI